MNDRTDRPTPIERAGAPDCLVEMALAWLQRPLGGQSQSTRADGIEEICLLISQMRHREPRLMEVERARWVERVAVRLCSQCVARGYDGAVRIELERRVIVQMLGYHDWRERVAPIVHRAIASGPSDGGEIQA